MDMPEAKYLKELEYPSITEYIDERFNGITSIMTDNALVYGGAVNSIIAGLPIKGDLDVAVSHSEFMRIAQALANSTAWVQTDGDNIAENIGHGGYTTRAYSNNWHGKPSSKHNRYSDAKHLPIARIAEFKTVTDAKVQLIQAREQTGDPLEDALAIVRKVDLRCCGVAMDRFSRLLETVKGGFEDCKTRMLMINRYDPLRDEKRTIERMKKYLARGWKLGISFDQVMANFQKAQLEYHRQMLAAKHHKKGKGKAKFNGFKILPRAKRGSEIRLSKSYVNKVGSLLKLRGTMRKFAEADFSCELVFSDSLKSVGFISASPRPDLYLATDQAAHVMERVAIYFDEKYSVRLPRHEFKQKSKKSKSRHIPELRGYSKSKSAKGGEAKWADYGVGGYETGHAWDKSTNPIPVPVVENVESESVMEQLESESPPDPPDDTPAPIPNVGITTLGNAQVTVDSEATVGTVTHQLLDEMLGDEVLGEDEEEQDGFEDEFEDAEDPDPSLEVSVNPFLNEEGN